MQTPEIAAALGAQSIRDRAPWGHRGFLSGRSAHNSNNTPDTHHKPNATTAPRTARRIIDPPDCAKLSDMNRMGERIQGAVIGLVVGVVLLAAISFYAGMW